MTAALVCVAPSVSLRAMASCQRCFSVGVSLVGAGASGLSADGWTGGCWPNRYSFIESFVACGILAGFSFSNIRRLNSSPRLRASAIAFSHSHLSIRLTAFCAFRSVPVLVCGNGLV